MPDSIIKRFAWQARYNGWLASVILSLWIAAIGWSALQWRELFWPSIGDEAVDWSEMGMDPLQRLSYDVPLLIRHSLPVALRSLAGPPRITDNVAILYMDEDSTRRLSQTPGGPWSRALHAQLLRQLTEHGARAVLFDVIFDSETPDDIEFAEAIAQHGNVFLGATFTTNTDAPLTPEETQRFLQVGIASEQLSRRNKTLYKAARGWGLLTFRPVDSDYGVRRLYPGKLREGLDPWPAATWQVANALGAQLPVDDLHRFSRRWVNYYGPKGRIESLSYYRLLVPDGGVPPIYFKDKIVIVGARSQVGNSSRKLLDEFSTPWSRFRARAYTPGAEIHATILLNLLNHDWIERLPITTEQWFVILFGLTLGALRWLRPWPAVLAALGTALALIISACMLQWNMRLWSNWAVPVLIQVPLALGLALASRYYIEERRKRKLRQAFGFYLSPELADEIAERDFTLAPGGQNVIATMVFTDLEGFTSLSEKLGDTKRLGEVLVDYFTRTTDEILAEKGTVIKFIGDAVFAAWGAPVPQADHAERAVRAAWRLAQVSGMNVPIMNADGSKDLVHVRTRVGIHTGEALAGNLGSARRFDYTLIGDAVNIASRLEGVNKYMGTSLLLSDDTAKLIGGKFLIRRIGAIKVIGRAKSVVMHELIDDNPAIRPSWLETFDMALIAWTNGDFISARYNFEKVIAARHGVDGPSQYYLNHINEVRMTPAWTGEIELDRK